MPARKARRSGTQSADSPNAGKRTNSSRSAKMENISRSTSQIVTEAASLLDEELAAGIVAARKMQDRFRRDRAVSPGDFHDALQKFQADAHEVVNLLNTQVNEFQSGKNSDLVKGLVANVHNLLDLAVEMVNTGAELANQVIQKSPISKDKNNKNNGEAGGQRRR